MREWERSGTPTQTYTLQYGTEQIQHTTTAPDGTTSTSSAGWDAVKNVQLATTAIGATPTDTPIKANIAPIATGEDGTSPAVCFVSGTQICTTLGSVAVEDLVVGDEAVTASGQSRPVVWIGHRATDCRVRHDLYPVRIATNAFGNNQPDRDLWLSPGHPVLVGADVDNEGGHLVPIMCLVNGTTIERIPIDIVTYWHVELDQHGILLAEGLPVESYLDWGDRSFFSEAADHTLANPDFVVPGLAGRCRPVAIHGPIVEAERRRLDAVFAISLTAQCAWPDSATP